MLVIWSSLMRDNVLLFPLLWMMAITSANDSRMALLPLDLACDDTCCEILEHHAAVLGAITKDPTTLVAAALAHCAAL
jgi:hypothetical protein